MAIDKNSTSQGNNIIEINQLNIVELYQKYFVIRAGDIYDPIPKLREMAWARFTLKKMEISLKAQTKLGTTSIDMPSGVLNEQLMYADLAENNYQYLTQIVQLSVWEKQLGHKARLQSDQMLIGWNGDQSHLEQLHASLFKHKYIDTSLATFKTHFTLKKTDDTAVNSPKSPLIWEKNQNVLVYLFYRLSTRDFIDNSGIPQMIDYHFISRNVEMNLQAISMTYDLFKKGTFKMTAPLEEVDNNILWNF